MIKCQRMNERTDQMDVRNSPSRNILSICLEDSQRWFFRIAFSLPWAILTGDILFNYYIRRKIGRSSSLFCKNGIYLGESGLDMFSINQRSNQGSSVSASANWHWNISRAKSLAWRDGLSISADTRNTLTYVDVVFALLNIKCVPFFNSKKLITFKFAENSRQIIIGSRWN